MLDSLDTLIAFALVFTVVSLLVTVVVQMISSALNLRGHNLAWALAESFQTIAPDLRDKAKALADHLLKDTLLSDKQLLNLTRKASAVRTEELFEVLRKIARGEKSVGPELQASAAALLQAVGIAAPPAPGAGVSKEVQQIAGAAFAALDDLSESQRKQALETFNRHVEGLASKAQQQIDAAQEELAVAYRKFQAWVGMGQERAQEWFRLHASVATLTISALFAFWLQLDAVEIFKRAATDEAMRAKLVAQTSVVLGQGEKVLGAQKHTLEEAFKAWRQNTKLASVLEPTLAANPGETRDRYRARVEATLAAKLAETKADAKPAEINAALAAFALAVDAQASAELKEHWANYRLISADVENTGFNLFPAGTNWRWGPKWADGLGDHFVGMLFSVLLLSLGAPFWFNLLKGLASLRSAVAANISKEEQPGNAGGGNPTKPRSPAAAPVLAR